nr:MAG TPA: DNA polymerase III, alpha subunit [Caudoviricetes sp.]
MNNYLCYHLHDDEGSVLDSCTKYQDYIDLAVKNGMTAIGSSNHGYILNWTSKKFAAEKAGLKFIYGVECYLTDKLWHQSPGEEKPHKLRDNYHTILIARNTKGIIEINNLVSRSFDAEHKYYKPRVTFDEFMGLSRNVITTSACLASPLRRYNESVEDFDPDRYEQLLKRYDLLEIQYHNCKDQIEFNQYLYELSQKYNKPLIAATDTHNSTPYKAECRKLLMEAKGIEFSGEDDFDLTFKSYEELVAAFEEQDAMPREVWMDAIENTNRLAGCTKDFKLNTAARYPILTGSQESDAKMYIEKTRAMTEDKIRKGIIPHSEAAQFRRDIEEELAVFKKTNMLGFMASMSDLMCWAKEKGIPIGPSRGSVAGSRAAFATDIIDVDPVRWNLVFSRFCNENRVEIGDIDIDVPDKYRPQIYKHIFDSFGHRNCAYVLAVGTMVDNGTIDEIGRALARRWKKEHPVGFSDSCNPYSLDKIAQVKKEYEEDTEQCRANHPDIFYYFDGMKDVAVSLSHHAAGVIISPIDLCERFGTFIDKDGLQILMLDMDASHAVGLAKYDILGLSNIEIISETCKMAGIKYPHTWEMDFDDQAVWADMKTSPISIFQFGSSFAFESLKKFDAKSIFDLSLVTAAIRPGGASYRDSLFRHEWTKTPSEEIDELLKDSYHNLVFQEQIIAFLQQICGLSGGDADSVRRAIGHKDEKAIAAAMPQILEGYCNHSTKPREVAEKEAKAFLQVIEDASQYMFGLNHATGYSILTYYCAYYRYYYPVEFTTALLNEANNQKKILAGTQLAKERGITIMPIKFRHSLDKYMPDAKNRIIYKGMESIKYLNKKVGKELYALRDKQYGSFIDLLYDLEHTSINSRQLTILIELDFFSEFGNPDQLKAQVEIYEKYKTAKQLKKDELPMPESDVICESVTEKMYKNVDARHIIDYLVRRDTTDIKTSISSILQYEFTNLGYLQYTNPRLATTYHYVTAIEGKYKNKNITLYKLCSGETITYKIRPATMDDNPIKPGDIIKVLATKTEGKWSKDGETWVQSTTDFNEFLSRYSHVR